MLYPDTAYIKWQTNQYHPVGPIDFTHFIAVSPCSPASHI